ncbi:hypothetical protein, partial [Thiolapillus sp.]|uniref:hypothetical protein n=1 Tax=Thiolapillus sp. TaxID=2017437 RepID=UPI003AF8C315
MTISKGLCLLIPVLSTVSHFHHRSSGLAKKYLAHGEGMQLSWLEHRTVTPFNSAVWRGIFFRELTFSADSLSLSVHP